MSAGFFAVKRLLKGKVSSREVGLLIAFFVFICVFTTQHTGLLQFLEFHAYDFFIRHQPKAQTSDPIVLVEMTEADIHSPALDYPIYDDKLAELLRDLEFDHPAAIGLDIWRDIPVPKSGVYLDEFNRVLQTYSNIVAIFTLGGIAPPAILKSNPERIAFNDNFPVDVGVDRTIPKVRRSLLFGDLLPGQSFYSLPFHLALRYLERKGIEPELDPSDANSLRLGQARLRKFLATDGAYVGADAAGWQMLLDFKCPDHFTRYSFGEALSGHIPPGSLRDKIVLVGMNSASVSDERVTPIRRDHRGIEMQALTINQLLREALDGERPLQFWNDWLEDGWLLLWSLAGGATGYWVRSPWRFASTTAGCLLALAGIAWMAFSLGWWIPIVAPAAAYVPAAALVISYVSFQEKKQRGQLMQLFSRQVSPDIAQALWEQREEFLAGQRPRSQKLIATVLFTDLEGFSATSEKLEPALLMDWLNEYMGAMATAIMAHQGVIEKYIGDAIMAIFGVPLARTSLKEIRQDAHNAVRCALAMRTKMDELNAQWKERGLPVCGMRVGIHTGPLVAGSLGSAERQEYTVIGDSVNIASRLESFKQDPVDPAPPGTVNGCRILISEATYLQLSDDFQSRKIGAMTLKNKSEPVSIYEILSATK
jgi:adenylate cyclase